MSDDPDDERRALARLRALADLRRWRELEEAARQLLASSPDRTDVRAHLARALLLQDRVEEAVEVAERGLERAPADDWLGRVLTSAYVAAGRLDDADRLLDSLLSANPGSYHVRVLAARVALRRLRPEEAIDHARHAVASDGTRAGGYVMLAASLSEAGLPVEAEEVARQGLAVDPRSGDLHCQLAVALERTGRRADAASHWVEAGRVGRYPEVAVTGLRQLMVEPPLTWLWAVVGGLSLVLASIVTEILVEDAWTAAVTALALAAVATLVLTPALRPVVRRRRRARALATLPTEARTVLGLAGGDERS